MKKKLVEIKRHIDLSVAVYSYPCTDPDSRDRCPVAVR